MSVCHKIKSLPDKIIQLQNFIYFLSRHPLKLMPFNVFWYFSALANNSLGTTNIDNLIPLISLHPRGISRERGCVVVFSTWCYAHTDKLIPTEGIGNPWLNFRIMQSPLLYLSRLSATGIQSTNGSFSSTKNLIIKFPLHSFFSLKIHSN